MIVGVYTPRAVQDLRTLLEEHAVSKHHEQYVMPYATRSEPVKRDTCTLIKCAVLVASVFAFGAFEYVRQTYFQSSVPSAVYVQKNDEGSQTVFQP